MKDYNKDKRPNNTIADKKDYTKEIYNAYMEYVQYKTMEQEE